MTDRQRVARMKAHGIKYPWRTLWAARAARMRLSVACANLQLESAGGRNIFGHDPTISIPESWKGAAVTKDRYLYYKRRRAAYGFQGVGPCQLTSPGLQDQADKLGGCWRVTPNLVTGFRFLHGLIRRYGSVRLGFQHYNGSGPAAVAYGKRAAALVDYWHRILTG